MKTPLERGFCYFEAGCSVVVKAKVLELIHKNTIIVLVA